MNRVDEQKTACTQTSGIQGVHVSGIVFDPRRITEGHSHQQSASLTSTEGAILLRSACEKKEYSYRGAQKDAKVRVAFSVW